MDEEQVAGYTIKHRHGQDVVDLNAGRPNDWPDYYSPNEMTATDQGLDLEYGVIPWDLVRALLRRHDERETGE